MKKPGILLESGTNEVEILEFYIGEQSFGVNVAKIQAIVQYSRDKITRTPLRHPSMAGMLLHRGTTVPLIDLRTELGIAPRSESRIETDASDTDVLAGQQKAVSQIVLVTEFNNAVNSFLVDGVNRIHRISWQNINPMNPILARSGSEFTGSTNVEGKEVLILDMERIVSKIFTDQQMEHDHGELSETLIHSRSDARIILAEDSGTIRSTILDVLHTGGYENVTDFDNGLSAHDRIFELFEAAREEGVNVREKVTGVISDIEMPKMDGLTLCRILKSHADLKDIPVVLFSSLINEQMAAKCRSVGADSFISKPQIATLVDHLDRLCLAPEPAAAE
jgi:two-component system chemotaxis response regulator CheV